MSLVGPDGSVAGDEFGERDARFSYILISALSLLGRLDALEAAHDGRGRELVVANIVGSMNFDGAFGAEPGAESHGAQGESWQAWVVIAEGLTTVWVCVAGLAILGELGRVDRDLLGWWLSERQLPNGGLNGRPEKLEDVCYSWWNLAALSIIGKLHWINRDKLIAFILSAQVSCSWSHVRHVEDRARGNSGRGHEDMLTPGLGGRGYRRQTRRLGRRLPHSVWRRGPVAAGIPGARRRRPALLHAGRRDREAWLEERVHDAPTAGGVAIMLCSGCMGSDLAVLR